MVWYNTIRSKDHTSIYMNIIEFLSTYDIEKQTFNDKIRKFEVPMNLINRSQEKQSSVILNFLSIFVKF